MSALSTSKSSSFTEYSQHLIRCTGNEFYNMGGQTFSMIGSCDDIACVLESRHKGVMRFPDPHPHFKYIFEIYRNLDYWNNAQTESVSFRFLIKVLVDRGPLKEWHNDMHLYTYLYESCLLMWKTSNSGRELHSELTESRLDNTLLFEIPAKSSINTN